MTESSIPAAGPGLPNSPQLSRRNVLKPFAALSSAAVLGAVSLTAQAAPAVSPELLALIETHKQIEKSCGEIIDIGGEAIAEFKKLCEQIDVGER